MTAEKKSELDRLLLKMDQSQIESLKDRFKVEEPEKAQQAAQPEMEQPQLAGVKSSIESIEIELEDLEF